MADREDLPNREELDDTDTKDFVPGIEEPEAAEFESTDILPPIDRLVETVRSLAEVYEVALRPAATDREQRRLSDSPQLFRQETNFGEVSMYLSIGAGGRAVNEDGAFFISLGGNDYLVTIDGLGGHGSGDVATNTAIDALTIRLSASHVSDLPGTETLSDEEESSLADTAELGEPIDNAVATIGRVMEWNYAGFIDMSKGSSPSGKMGVCLTALQISETESPEVQNARFLNIGDTRGIVIRSEGIHFETKDHSVVQQMVDAGLISKDEALSNSLNHIVTNTISLEDGHNAAGQPDVYDVPLEEHDVVILASDGLWDNFTSEDVAEMIAGLDNSAEIVETLRRAVLERIAEHGGKDDNINIVVYIHGKKEVIS